jgi:hypothetical protein
MTSINPSPISVFKWDIKRKEKLFYTIRSVRTLIKTLQGQTEIDEVKTAAGQFPLGFVAIVFLAQT